MKQRNPAPLVSVLSILFAFCCSMTVRPWGSADAGESAMDSPAKEVQNLPVKYVKLSTGQFAPAHIDTERSVLYVWDGVRLQAEQVPNASPLHRTPVIDLSSSNSFEVLRITPETRYVPTGDVVSVGYYDRSSKTYYKWRGMSFSEEGIIPEAYHMLKSGTRKGEEIRREIEIPIPVEFFETLFRNER